MGFYWWSSRPQVLNLGHDLFPKLFTFWFITGSKLELWSSNKNNFITGGHENLRNRSTGAQVETHCSSLSLSSFSLFECSLALFKCLPQETALSAAIVIFSHHLMGFKKPSMATFDERFKVYVFKSPEASLSPKLSDWELTRLSFSFTWGNKFDMSSFSWIIIK